MKPTSDKPPATHSQLEKLLKEDLLPLMTSYQATPSNSLAQVLKFGLPYSGQIHGNQAEWPDDVKPAALATSLQETLAKLAAIEKSIPKGDKERMKAFLADKQKIVDAYAEMMKKSKSGSGSVSLSDFTQLLKTDVFSILKSYGVSVGDLIKMVFKFGLPHLSLSSLSAELGKSDTSKTEGERGAGKSKGGSGSLGDFFGSIGSGISELFSSSSYVTPLGKSEKKGYHVPAQLDFMMLKTKVTDPSDSDIFDYLNEIEFTDYDTHGIITRYEVLFRIRNQKHNLAFIEALKQGQKALDQEVGHLLKDEFQAFKSRNTENFSQADEVLAILRDPIQLSKTPEVHSVGIGIIELLDKAHTNTMTACQAYCTAFPDATLACCSTSRLRLTSDKTVSQFYQDRNEVRRKSLQYDTSSEVPELQARLNELNEALSHFKSKIEKNPDVLVRLASILPEEKRTYLNTLLNFIDNRDNRRRPDHTPETHVMTENLRSVLDDPKKVTYEIPPPGIAPHSDQPESLEQTPIDELKQIARLSHRPGSRLVTQKPEPTPEERAINLEAPPVAAVPISI
ncbi:hypothetical protein WDW86_18665, partial [Bdellovibrionota bacterium FG-2]